MHAAINSHRIARNFPWVNRYVLQVSQIVLETFAMLACTGSALVCMYCNKPNIAPITHIRIPRYISVAPLHAAQTLELHLRQVRNLNIALVGKCTRGTAQCGHQQNNPQPQFAFSHSFFDFEAETIAQSSGFIANKFLYQLVQH